MKREMVPRWILNRRAISAAVFRPDATASTISLRCLGEISFPRPGRTENAFHRNPELTNVGSSSPCQGYCKRSSIRNIQLVNALVLNLLRVILKPDRRQNLYRNPPPTQLQACIWPPANFLPR